MTAKHGFSFWAATVLLVASTNSRATVIPVDLEIAAFGEGTGAYADTAVTGSPHYYPSYYLAGQDLNYAQVWRNFFIYDLGSYAGAGTVTAATLTIKNNGIYAPGSTFSVGSVVDLDIVNNLYYSYSGSTMPNQYGNLAVTSGNLLGSTSAADQGTGYVTVNLNLAAMTALLGSKFALAGNLDGGTLFYADPGTATLHIEITDVPEPGVFLAMVPVLGAVIGHQVWRRRRKTA